MKLLPAAAVALALFASPLHAQRTRRSSGTHKGIPCGRSYISANKVCHIAPSASANDPGLSPSDSAYLRSLRTPAAATVATPTSTAPLRSSPADLDAIRRERDSLRIVVATMKQMCAPHP